MCWRGWLWAGVQKVLCEPINAEHVGVPLSGEHGCVHESFLALAEDGCPYGSHGNLLGFEAGGLEVELVVCCGERKLEGLSVDKLTQLEACCYLVGAGDWVTAECEVQNMYSIYMYMCTLCCDTHVVMYMYSTGVHMYLRQQLIGLWQTYM